MPFISLGFCLKFISILKRSNHYPLIDLHWENICLNGTITLAQYKQLLKTEELKRKLLQTLGRQGTRHTEHLSGNEQVALLNSLW